MPNHCPDCKLSYPTDAERCLACGRPAPLPDYPNVVLAQKDDERAELARLYRSAMDSARRKGTARKLSAFRKAVGKNAQLITACEFEKFFNLCAHDNSVFATFQRLLHAEQRFVGDDPLNKARLKAEEATLPGCADDIRYAALTMDSKGLRGYGKYYLIWNPEMVAHRTTLFFANCVTWRYEIGLALNAPAPLGHRAEWQYRQILSVVKHYNDIDKSTRSSQFPKILMRNESKKEPYGVFIEAHIWGYLSRRSLLKVVCSSLESTKGRRYMVKEIVRNLRKIGITVKGG